MLKTDVMSYKYNLSLEQPALIKKESLSEKEILHHLMLQSM